MSEVAYYLDEEACELLAARACTGADELVAVHCTHPVPDYPLGGDRVHTILAGAAARSGLALMVSHREPDFRIDCWCRDSRSLAARTGLVTE